MSDRVTTADSELAENRNQGSVLEVLRASTRLGLTSFGGPIAHLGYFHEEYVKRRKWIDEQSYADLVALCQFLPGPASSQVSIAIGILRARFLGGIAAWIGFTLPSALALIAFGLDSAVEGVASIVIVWRFSGSRIFSDRAERRAQTLVAVQFFILVPFIAFEAIETLLSGGHIETSYLGIGLTLATLAICQPLGLAKRRLGAKLGSHATVGEGTQNLLCAYLAIAVLIGLLMNASFGIWWLDPLVALGIAAVAFQEGRKALRGEGCGCACEICANPRNYPPETGGRKATSSPSSTAVVMRA